MRDITSLSVKHNHGHIYPATVRKNEMVTTYLTHNQREGLILFEEDGKFTLRFCTT